MKLEIDLDIPADVIDGEFEKALREDAVLRLFAERKIPSGDATRLLGIDRVHFLNLIERRGIALADYTTEDFLRDKEDMDAILKDSGRQ
jgi:predicted HTH domain antitoxin